MRLDCSAHAFRVQFATFEKFKYLVRSQREVVADWEDYLPIRSLHREAHSHSMFPQ